MSKRNTKQGMYQQASTAKRRTPGARPNAKSAKSKTSGSNASGARSFNRPAQPEPRVTTQASLLTVRIAAILIAVAAVLGGSAWALSIQNSQGSYGAWQITGLIVLGFLAGLGIAVAIRTKELVARVGKMMSDRR
jgi:hypothetical protein